MNGIGSLYLAHWKKKLGDFYFDEKIVPWTRHFLITNLEKGVFVVVFIYRYLKKLWLRFYFLLSFNEIILIAYVCRKGKIRCNLVHYNEHLLLSSNNDFRRWIGELASAWQATSRLHLSVIAKERKGVVER